jgi:hypothetical protein
LPVLDLKVPSLQYHQSVRELGYQLLDIWPKLLKRLISFIIVCKFWLNHHYVLGLASYTDYGLVCGRISWQSLGGQHVRCSDGDKHIIVHHPTCLCPATSDQDRNGSLAISAYYPEILFGAVFYLMGTARRLG